MTALRLLQRMKRDWMCHGRRPTGLVGAAILIAAKYHGFKRTINQIVQIVQVCDETIRKRLVEFKQTPVARLTREEFENIDLEKDIKEECDPPSFKRATGLKEILRLANHEKELVKKASIIESQIKDAVVKEEDEGREDESTVAGHSGAMVLYSQDGNLSVADMQSQAGIDFDDNEIEGYILTKEESQIKSIIWHRMHKEWLEEQEIKEKKKSKAGSGVKRRKKNKESSLGLIKLLTLQMLLQPF